VTVDFTDVITQDWKQGEVPNFAVSVIANNVAFDSVIKFRFKSATSGSSVIVRNPRLTFDGVPQSYIVE
jgi:hypothetical protein